MTYAIIYGHSSMNNYEKLVDIIWHYVNIGRGKTGNVKNNGDHVAWIKRDKDHVTMKFDGGPLPCEDYSSIMYYWSKKSKAVYTISLERLQEWYKKEGTKP